MSYWWLTYAIILASWAVFEYRDLRRSGFPFLVLVADSYALVALCAVSFMKAFGRPIAIAAPLVLVVVLSAVAVRILAFRHEEWDLDLSPRQNVVYESIALVVVLLLIAPAMYLLVTPRTSWSVATAAIAAGVLLGAIAPRLRSCKRWEAERLIAEWAASSREFGRVPEATELPDRRELPWPGEDGPRAMALVRFRLDDQWRVGIVGPYVFAFADQDRIAGKPLEDVYAEYAAHYASEVLQRYEDAEAL